MASKPGTLSQFERLPDDLLLRCWGTSWCGGAGGRPGVALCGG